MAHRCGMTSPQHQGQQMREKKEGIVGAEKMIICEVKHMVSTVKFSHKQVDCYQESTISQAPWS